MASRARGQTQAPWHGTSALMFNTTGDEEIKDMASDFTLQLTLCSSLLIQLQRRIKEESLSLFEKAIEVSSFPNGVSERSSH